jgi:hypothetical protein
MKELSSHDHGWTMDIWEDRSPLDWLVEFLDIMVLVSITMAIITGIPTAVKADVHP